MTSNKPFPQVGDLWSFKNNTMDKRVWLVLCTPTKESSGFWRCETMDFHPDNPMPTMGYWQFDDDIPIHTLVSRLDEPHDKK